ncbi:DUF3048 domain-containing protein [Eisenbergiella tayi]|jgi:hypothetical protein|nr:DUF3048 domain-containing protein [Eisenbergiella tayi]GKH59066.1 hypothetical protein CE91St58_64510 [Lachnospiraceae bacterium]
MMKKLGVSLLVGLTFAMLLFGCGKEKAEEETVPATEETAESLPVETESETETETVAEDVPPEEGMVRSSLTNEWISGDIADQRPIAVMVPNDSSALPHYSLSKADILYECPVEGNITRLMAIFKDWDNDDMKRIGNVRSSRDYFVYWAFEYDAIYFHFGGPYYIAPVIEQKSTDNVTGANYGGTGKKGIYGNAYYRSSDRKAPQNAYLSAEGANEAIDKLGISKTYRDNYYDPDHFKFAPESSPNTLDQYSNAITVKKLDMAKCYPISKTYFEYNEEDGLFYRFEYGKPHVDAGFDNTQLAFKNVLVQFAYYEVRDEKGYLTFQDHDTTRDGYYFTNGKGIHVNWKKSGDYDPTKFYDDDGNEIELNTGKTMICVVEEGDTFGYE